MKCILEEVNSSRERNIFSKNVTLLEREKYEITKKDRELARRMHVDSCRIRGF